MTGSKKDRDLWQESSPLARVQETLLPAQEGEVLELDEMWAYVGVCGQQEEPGVAMDRALSSHPAGGGLAPRLALDGVLPTVVGEDSRRLQDGACLH